MNRLMFNRVRFNRKLNTAIVVAVVIIFILLVTLIFSLANKKKIEQVEHEKEVGGYIASSIRIDETGILDTSNSKFKIDVRIPFFTNLKVSSFNSYINDKIAKDFDYEKVFDELTAGMQDKESLSFEYNVDFERYDFYQYVSIVVTENSKLSGSRPRTIKRCYVINAEESRTATIKDLVNDKINYKTDIVNEINEQAKNNNIEIYGGEITSIDDDQSFYIKDEKLHIFFNASYIAANSFGDLDFEMPFNNEKDIFIVRWGFYGRKFDCKVKNCW